MGAVKDVRLINIGVLFGDLFVKVLLRKVRIDIALEAGTAARPSRP